MNRKQKIIVSITGIFLVLIILVGLTYGYFLTKISGNTNTKSVSVTTANISIEYLEGNNLVTSDKMMPGESITKTFSVKNTGNVKGSYSISLINVVNELKNYQDLAWTLKKGDTIVATGVFPLSSRVIVFNEEILPPVDSVCNSENGCINNYELEITYINQPYDQSEDMNKSFSALVQITNSEKIINIDTIEQIKALSRILTYNQVQDARNLVNDAKLLDTDCNYTAKEDIISYFQNKSYSLNNDITIEYNTEYGDNYFNGIGCLKYKFGGIIYGNNHKLNIDYSNLQYKSYMQGVGFINYLVDGAIYDLNINVDSDILLNQIDDLTTSYNPSIGILVGNSNNSNYENISITLNHDFKFDLSNSSSNNYTVNMGLVNGYALNTNNYNNIKLNINDSNIVTDVTTSKRSNNYINTLGLVVGQIFYELSPTESSMSHISVNSNNSNLTLNVNEGMIGMAGGMIGRLAARTNLKDSSVNFYDSSISIFNNNSGNTTKFEAISLGGIAGSLTAGSDNSTNLGRAGVTIDNVSFTSENTTLKNTLYAKENKGGPVNVGGIYGFSYNNSLVNNSKVILKNAKIVGEKLGENDTAASVGTNVGGIAGRFEHTGKISNSSVNSTNSVIYANTTEKNNAVGGIAGYAFNPLHKDLDPLNNNSFEGNGSTTIKLNIIEGNNAIYQNAIGALAGHAQYVISDNKVSNATVEMSGVTSTTYKDQIYISNYIGNYIADITETTNFDKRAGEIKNPSINNIIINTNGLDNKITIKKY